MREIWFHSSAICVHTGQALGQWRRSFYTKNRAKPQPRRKRLNHANHGCIIGKLFDRVKTKWELDVRAQAGLEGWFWLEMLRGSIRLDLCSMLTRREKSKRNSCEAISLREGNSPKKIFCCVIANSWPNASSSMMMLMMWIEFDWSARHRISKGVSRGQVNHLLSSMTWQRTFHQKRPRHDVSRKPFDKQPASHRIAKKDKQTSVA